MGNALLQSVLVASVLLGMLAARRRRLHSGLWQLLAGLLVYDAAYILLFYYLGHRWS